MYGYDHREAARYRWYDALDLDRMTAEVTVYDDDGDEEEVEVPFAWEVCSTCNGRGAHVKPGVDAGGLTAEDFDRLGRGFREDYFSGRYDVACYGCKGRTTVPVINRNVCDGAILARIDAKVADDAAYAAEVAAERRWGC